MSNIRLSDSWLCTRKNGDIIVDPHTKEDSAFYILNAKGQLISKVYTGLAYFNDPFFSPDGNRIVFRGSPDKFKKGADYFDELYTIDTDGTDLRQLTHYPVGDTLAEWWEYHAGPPFWEPTRNLITYNSVQFGFGSLFQIDPETGIVRKLTPDSLEVGWHTWSSDGNWITFDAIPTDTTLALNYDICVMNYESGKIQRITSEPVSEQAPVFVEVNPTL